MTNKMLLKIFMAATFLMAVTGCTKKSETVPHEVNLAIWNNYISSELLERFTKETGIKVNVSTYASNDELLAKVQSGASQFDVAVPSDYMVDIMKKLELLQKLQINQIPNAKNLNDIFLKQYFDPANEYSLPYAWTTVGIAVNTELFKGKMESWKDFFENKEIAGKVSMLDDSREALAVPLKMQGASVNTTDKAEIEKATQSLLKMKKKLKLFQSEAVDLLLHNEVQVAQAYSSDALQVFMKTKGKIKFILPTEGGTQAIDNVVILKGAQHIEPAHKLINFLLSNDVNVEFVKAVMGGPVLKDTQKNLPLEIASNTALFPPPTLLTKFESLKDLGDNIKIYEKAWTDVKTQ